MDGANRRMQPLPPPPPTPAHTLRTHAATITSVFFSCDNERIYAGDGDGIVSITSTRTFRPLAKWKAHGNGILGVQEWVGRRREGHQQEQRKVITHGRDNKLHIWVLESATRTLREAAMHPDLPTPKLVHSMDVNALNYCRFSFIPHPDDPDDALIALPNLVESSFADVWSLPSLSRLYAAIGKRGGHTPTVVDGRGLNALGIIMSLHLYTFPLPSPPTSAPSSSSSANQTQLRLLSGYENGSVTLWAFDGVGTGGTAGRWTKRTSVEGVGWGALWTAKLHVESVMAMSVTRDNTVALTVSADHLIGRYDLTGNIPSADSDLQEDNKGRTTIHRTKHPGNGSIAIRDDGKVCSVGGWDGKIRLYSTKSLKPLGTLTFHRKNVDAIAFAHPRGYHPDRTIYAKEEEPSDDDGGDDNTDNDDEEEDDDDEEVEMTKSEKEARTRWLVAGSQDRRVSVWPLMSFEKGKKPKG